MGQESLGLRSWLSSAGAHLVRTLQNQSGRSEGLTESHPSRRGAAGSRCGDRAEAKNGVPLSTKLSTNAAVHKGTREAEAVVDDSSCD